MKWLKILFILMAVIYVLVSAFFYFFQESILFWDTQLRSDHQFSFKEKFVEISIDTNDGAKLHGLYFRADSAKGIIVYYHGNAGDVERWGNIVEKFVPYGYDVLVMDYRGYGKSTGKRSESNMLQDAQLFFNVALKKYSHDKIIVYGRSLGTGFATYVAGNNICKHLILETPYYSLLDIGKTKYPLVMNKLLLRYPMRSDLYIRNVTCPITIFHGTGDETVEYKFGKKLLESVNDKAELVTIEGGNHGNLAEYDVYWEKIEELLH